MSIVVNNSKPEMKVTFPGDNVHELRVVLSPESEGGYSIFATNLPGVMSQGDTADEALANIREAFKGVILEYKHTATAIPWGEVDLEDIPRGSKELWIVVNV